MSENKASKWEISNANRISELEKKLELIDTIATSTAIGTDTLPKQIASLREKFDTHDNMWHLTPSMWEQHEKTFGSWQNSFQEQLNELREKLKLERKVKVWDAKVINRMNKQLSELKAKVESLKDVEQSRDNIKEDLRELILRFGPHIKDYSGHPILYLDLLAKLDGFTHKSVDGGETWEKTEKKEVHICVYCGGKLKYSHKFVSEDEDRVYQFKCTKCGKISQTEHFNSFLGVIKDSGAADDKELVDYINWARKSFKLVKREDSYHIRLFSPERHFTIYCDDKLPTGQYTINIKKEERVRDATRQGGVRD